MGLAKAVGRPDEVRAISTEATLQPTDTTRGDETAYGSAIGTPAFMSPEQAAGRWDIVNVASDIYSLGGILYTLLTGRPPFTKGNWPELLQKIQRGDFPRPRQIKPDVPQALVAICLKAMSVEVEDRYASAQALAADVERWLADEPVLAWREPVWAKVWRWMRRHKTLVSGMAVLLVSVLVAAAAGLIVLDRANQQIAAERNAARTAADQAQAVNDFLTTDLLGQADPDVNDRTKKITVEELLNRAARKIDGNAKLAAQPEVEASLQLTIGTTFFKLGNFPEAEKHLRRAMDLRRQTFGLDDSRTLAAQEALANFLNLGPGRFADAQELSRQTWEARARVLGPEHPDTLDSLDTYATALNQGGEFAEASARYEECLTIRRRVIGPHHPDTIISMNNLSTALLDQGKWNDAIPLLREGLDLSKDLGNRGADYAINVLNLGLAFFLKGDLDEADRLLQEQLKRLGEQFGADHPLSDRARGIQVRVWIDQGRLDAALSLAREVVASRRRMYGDTRFTAMALGDLGRALVLHGDYAAGEDALAQALRIYGNQLQRPRYIVAWTRCWHGAALLGLRRFEDAERVLLVGEEKLRNVPDLPVRHYQDLIRQLIQLYEALGKPDTAAKWRQARETS